MSIGIFSTTYQGELHGARMTARAIKDILPMFMTNKSNLPQNERYVYLKAVLCFISEHAMEYVDNGYLTDFRFRNFARDKKGKLTYCEAYYMRPLMELRNQ